MRPTAISATIPLLSIQWGIEKLLDIAVPIAIAVRGAVILLWVEFASGFPRIGHAIVVGIGVRLPLGDRRHAPHFPGILDQLRFAGQILANQAFIDRVAVR